MKILVITSEPDAHLPLIQQHLDEQLIVFDPFKFPFDTDITYRWNPSVLLFEVWSEARKFSDVDAVWYRKPKKLTQDQMPVEKLYQAYAHSAYSYTIDMLFGILRNKLWVSNYWNIKIASNKLLQTEVAARLGMNVPPTLVTSSADEAHEFLAQQAQCVTKMTGIHHVFDDEASYVFYTSRLGDNPELSGLCVAPSMFQVEIDKRIDLRVTVVGEHVFPCEIHQHGEFADSVDWREGIFEEGALTYTLHEEFPRELSRKCVSMLKELGLKFGAFDFILDKNGIYWFVEVNPNGQWGFVELEGGIQISPAFIDVFRNG